jgi:ubiquinone/menaquinone biosynthesis C-methylase UbiE
MSTPSASPHYVCGHSSFELARLDQQDRIYREFTREMLERVGISEGMRVLDLGCGAGSLSVIAAGMVGENGIVLGVDRAAEPIETARSRASRHGITNVEFVQAEIDQLNLDQPFDALVGRFVLMHQSSPAETLHLALRHLTAVPRIAILESDLVATLAVAERIGSIACSRAIRYMMDIIEAAGAHTDLGLRLHHVFHDAGLHPADLDMYMPIETCPDGELIPYTINSLTSIGTSAIALGKPTVSEAELSGLAAQMEHDCINHKPVLAPMVVSAVFVKR